MTIKLRQVIIAARFRPQAPHQVIIAGHAFMQDLQRGHDERGLDAPDGLRVAAAFDELAQAI